jgi:hypothetical protein
MAKKKISRSLMKSGGNIPLVASLIVLVAFIFGLLIGTLVVAKTASGVKISGLSQMTGSFADGYNAAKKKLNDSGFFPHQTGLLSGTISSINGQDIVFSTSLVNPLDDASLTSRTAVVTPDTVITLYRQKTPTQIAADQAAGQKAITDIQTQITTLQSQMSKCSQGNLVSPATPNSTSDACIATSKQYADALQKQSQIVQQMDVFEKVDNASLSDLKAGMQITVYGTKISQSVNQAGPTPIAASSFTDISEQSKFNVSAIEARDVPALAAPIIPTIHPTASSTPAAPTNSTPLN